MSDFPQSQMMQAVQRMVMLATVVERQGTKVRVRWSEGAVSGWLHLAQLGSATQRFWIPQEAGDQVLVLSPGGDTAHGIVYPGPFASDGAPEGNFDGTFTGTGDLVAEGVSLVEHTHPGDGMGPGDTGPPS